MLALQVQDLVWQRWLEFWRRIGAELEPVLARLSARRTELGLAVALDDLLHDRRRPVAARRPCWAWRRSRSGPRCGRPTTTERRRARALAASLRLGNDGVWRMVVDAVPEPAVVLDGAGYVMHANRMAEDLFGARRRGGHVASMSRDPELLAAVDQALASGETAPSSCTSACRSSGACWRRSPRSSARGPARPAPRSSSRFAT